MSVIHLGYEIGSGKSVEVPLGHTIVTGQSQRSGKTTALEAMAARAGGNDVMPTVIAFVTKRGEGSFAHPRPHPMQPFFKQRADWRFVAATLESAFSEKMKFERAWIVKACKGADTLADVRRNAAVLSEKAKRGMDKDLFMLIGEYLDEVLPDIERLPHSSGIFNPVLSEVNVVDIVDWRSRMQMLFVASVLDHVVNNESRTVIIIPESWALLPERRNTPVKEFAIEIARKGAAVDNYLWLDCQDTAGVSKEIIRQSSVWLLGVQRESNEIKRTLAHIPAGLKKPKADDVARLELGQFFACTPDGVVKTYVRPAWMPIDVARRIATGQLKVAQVVSERKALAARTPVVDAPPWKPPSPGLNLEDVVTSLVAGLRNEIVKRLDTQQEEISKLSESVGMLMRGDWPVMLPPTVPFPPTKRPAFVDPGRGPRQAVVRAAVEERVKPKKITYFDAKGWPAVEEDLYQKFKTRFISELRDEAPKILQVLATKPELDVLVERKTVSLNGDSLRGRLAALIHGKFFDEAKEDKAILKELYRRGGTIGDARNYKRELGWLAENGFVTVEEDGYRAVRGMKINLRDA